MSVGTTTELTNGSGKDSSDGSEAGDVMTPSSPDKLGAGLPEDSDKVRNGSLKSSPPHSSSSSWMPLPSMALTSTGEALMLSEEFSKGRPSWFSSPDSWAALDCWLWLGFTLVLFAITQPEGSRTNWDATDRGFRSGLCPMLSLSKVLQRWLMCSLTGKEVKGEGVTSVALGVGQISAVGKVMMTFPWLGPITAELGTVIWGSPLEVIEAVGKVMISFPWFRPDESVTLFAPMRVLPALLADLFLHLIVCFLETEVTFWSGWTFWLANFGSRGGSRLRAFSTSLADGGGLDRVEACEEGTRDDFFLDEAGRGRGLKVRARASGRLGG